MVKLEELEQSLLTTNQYIKLSKSYRTYNSMSRRSQFHGNPPACWKMGESFSVLEINKINDRIEEFRKCLPRLVYKDTTI